MEETRVYFNPSRFRWMTIRPVFSLSTNIRLVNLIRRQYTLEVMMESCHSKVSINSTIFFFFWSMLLFVCFFFFNF